MDRAELIHDFAHAEPSEISKRARELRAILPPDSKLRAEVDRLEVAMLCQALREADDEDIEKHVDLLLDILPEGQLRRDVESVQYHVSKADEHTNYAGGEADDEDIDEEDEMVQHHLGMADKHMGYARGEASHIRPPKR